MNDYKWYTLKVIGGREEKVKNYLEAEQKSRKMQNQISQIFIPSEKVYEMRGGKRQVREQRFGYLYVCVEALDNGVMDLVRETPDAMGLLGARGWGATKEPIPLRQSEVNRILGKAEEEKGDEVYVGQEFLVGEMVRVTDGPFSGFSGNIQDVFEERKKLSVTVKIFERNTPVELGYGQVEKFSWLRDPQEADSSKLWQKKYQHI